MHQKNNSETDLSSFSSETTNRSLPKSDSLNVIDYLEVLIKHKFLITVSTLLAFIISIIVSLLLPNIYSSTTRILPPQQDQSLVGMMFGQMGATTGLASELLGKGSPADLYVGILNSEAVLDPIIDKFNLIEKYERKFRIDTYSVLEKNVDISSGKKDGIISITVMDKNPKLAADIANAFVEELEKLMLKLNITGARHNISFLENRLTKAKMDLARAEENFKVFQTKNMALDVAEQTKGTIKGIADLTAQVAVEEVKLVTLQRSMTDTSQEVKNQKSIVSNLKAQISRFEGEKNGGIIPSVGSVPALGQEYVRLMREFKTQETLVELLTKQYEMSKFAGAKDVAGIQVIQKATLPDKKSKPRRASIVLVSTFMICMASIFAAFLLEYLKHIPTEDYERLKNILFPFSYIKKVKIRG